MRTPMLILCRVVLTLSLLWGVGLLWYQVPALWLRLPLLLLWLGLGGVGWLDLAHGRWWRYGLGLLALLLFWLMLKPSHERQWADDVAQLLDASIVGDVVTLDNVRDFAWRSETDYTARWVTRQYDISQIESADLILSYWMGPAIAHTLISFRFSDGQRLVFSLEIRKEAGEQFSALGGFFKQFEVVVIAATEEDIVRTRTNARGEDVYVYRLNVPPAGLQALFKEYLATAAAIKQQPRYYHTLTSNCTTIIYDLAKKIVPLPLDYRLLLSGYFAEYAYDLQGLMPGYDYQTLHDLGHVNARALAHDEASAWSYSEAIRVGVPQMARPVP
ncbi:MAG: DUF4105 domain-containing protein [Neisseriaceae bacterium]|nr:DUF4105 domain-containing protein [Neisseriaceae bacterium]